MHHATKEPSPRDFEFLLEEDYKQALRDGWVFNKSELKKDEPIKETKPVEPEVVDKQEEEAESMPEDLERAKFQCGECDFIGKNAQSLRMHIRHNHGVK